MHERNLDKTIVHKKGKRELLMRALTKAIYTIK